MKLNSRGYNLIVHQYVRVARHMRWLNHLAQRGIRPLTKAALDMVRAAQAARPSAARNTRLSRSLFEVDHLETRQLLSTTLTGLNNVVLGTQTYTSAVYVDGTASLHVIGDLILDAGSSLAGNSAGANDIITLNVDGNVTIRGPIGGGGLQNVFINAGQGITIDDGVNIDLTATGGDLNLVVNAAITPTLLTLTPFFNELNSTAQISIGSANIKANNIVLSSNATTSKFASFDIVGDAFANLLAGSNLAAMSGTPLLTFADAGVGTPTIKRSAGSWVGDGFGAGMAIKVVNSGANDGDYTIASLTSDTLTLSSDDVLHAASNVMNVVVQQPLTSILPDDVPLTPEDRAGATVNPSTGSISAGQIKTQLLKNISESRILNVNALADAVVASASSNIIIHSGAVLTATHALTVDSSADSEVTLNTPSIILGFAYGKSEGTATATISSGAKLSAGGQVTVDTRVTNNLAVTVSVGSSLVMAVASKFVKLPGPSFAVAYGKGISTSLTTVEAGASISGGAVSITSNNTNAFDVEANSKSKPQAGFGVAAGVAISDMTSTSTTNVAGTVSSGAALVIDAKAINTKNTVDAESVVKNKPVGGNTLQSAKDKITTLPLDPRSQPGNLDIAASVAFAASSNEADAAVLSGAVLTAQTDLSVTSRAEDNFKAIALGLAKASGKVSIGGAVAVSTHSNIANASIGAASVNAKGTLNVEGTAIIPNQIQVDNDLQSILNFSFDMPSISTSDPKAFYESVDNFKIVAGQKLGVFSNLTPYLSSNLGVANKLATTYVAASSEAGDKAYGDAGYFAISGSINLLTVTNTSNAWIGTGALINQDAAYRAANQNVLVDAETSIETINIGGIPGIKNIVTGNNKSDGGSVGGTYAELTFNNTANAYIADGADVYAKKNVYVTAHSHNLLVTVNEAGGKGKAFGIEGAFSLNHVTNNTTARIEDGAVVEAGNDVKVNAVNDGIIVNVTGAISQAQGIGLGVTVSYNDIKNVIKAFIGSQTPSALPTGSVTAGHDVIVDANSNQKLITVGIAAAIANSASQPEGDSEGAAGDGLDGDSASSLVGENASASKDAAKEKGGIGLSGDVAINDLNDTVQAYISGPMVVTATHDVAVTAENDSMLVSVAGALALDLAKGNGGAGIAGAFTMNQAARDTRAYIQDATVNAADVLVTAYLHDRLYSVTAGAGGGKKATVAIAGSLNLNLEDETTEASIKGSAKVTTTGTVTVHGEYTLSQVSVAGGIAAGDKAAVGAAIDLSLINTTVNAFIGDTANVVADGTIKVTAFSDEYVVSVGASIALSKKLGLSGAASAQSVNPTVNATIAGGATVYTQQSLLLDAHDNANFIQVGGAAGGGKDAGIGAAAAVLVMDRDVNATVVGGATVTALGTGAAISDPWGKVTGNGLIVHAGAVDTLHLIGAGGSGSEGLALAGSAVVDVITSDVEAMIGNGAHIDPDNTGASNNQSVYVVADGASSILAVAGSVAGSTEAGIGAAADVEKIDKTVKATIGSAATVNAANSVLVTATSSETMLDIAVGIGGSGEAGLAGSASVIVLNHHTMAEIMDGAKVTADGNVVVLADNDTTITPVGGAAGIGGGAGFGLSNTTVVETDVVDAGVGAATVVARGNHGGTVVPTAALADGSKSTSSIAGLSVTATSQENILSIAVGAGGAGDVGVAGSASVNVLDLTTHAHIDNGATINPSNTGANANQTVNVLALDRTQIFGIGGAVAFGGTAGVGAGADVLSLTKDTQGFIGAATVNAANNILVQGLSAEKLTSVSASGAGSGSVGIAGSAGVYVLNLTTRAFIGDDPSDGITPAVNANVHATANIVVSAVDLTNADIIDGNISVSGVVSVGAAAGVSVVTKKTEAFIGQKATVVADGLGGTTTAYTGLITPGLAASETGSSSFPTVTGNGVVDESSVGVHSPGAQSKDVTGDGSNDVNNPELTGQRTTTLQTAPLRGLAVTAINRDDIEAIGATGGVSGTVAVNIGGTVLVITADTEAYIATGAQVNVNDAAGASDQSVLVAAGNDLYHLGITGIVSIGGVATVTPGADISIIKNMTKAYIADGARVDAKLNITVSAKATEDIMSIVAGVSASGGIAFGGSASVVSEDNVTYAFIGNSAVTDGLGAVANAGGNIQVVATDDTKAFMIAGNLSIGLGIGAAGGSVGVLLINKDTQAFVGDHATVNAKGNAADLAGVWDGTVPTSTSFGTTTVHGLVVQASTTEDVFVLAATGAGGLFAGLAGGVTIESLNSNTKAIIGSSANINTSNVGAAVNQGVFVNAANRAKVWSFAGGVALGAAAVAGGVDVGMLRNNTEAYVEDGADITATGSVEVNAVSAKDVTSFGMSGAGGIAAFAGTVSVWSIGTVYNSNYTVGGNSALSVKTSGLSSTANADGSSTSFLSGYSSEDRNGAIPTPDNTNLAGKKIALAKEGIANNSISGKANAAINSGAPTAGNLAHVGSATIHAGGHVSVDASENLNVNQIVGSVAVGFIGVGGAISILNVKTSTEAYVGSGASITAGTGAGNDVNVDATQVTTVNEHAYAGQAGFDALGAQVTVVNDTSTQLAHVDQNAAILQANTVKVVASATRTIIVNSANGGLGLTVAAGAGVAIVDMAGTTTARIGTSGGGLVQIGNGGLSVGGIGVTANSIGAITLNTKAVTAGLVGGATGASARGDLHPTVTATIVNTSANVTGSVAVVASATGDVASDALGVAVGGGLAAGVIDVHAGMTPILNASIGGSSVILAGGNVVLQSLFNNNETKRAYAHGVVGSGALIAGVAGAQQDANASATLNAGIDTTARVDANGSLTVSALATNSAVADGTGLTIGGILGVGTVTSTANANGSVTARIDGDVSDGGAGAGASSITVLAQATNNATSSASSSGGGLISGNGATAHATASPTLVAEIGSNSGSHAVNASNGITVTARSLTNADAVGHGKSGGLAAVGVVSADATTSPNIDTHVGTGMTVRALNGTLTLQSFHNVTDAGAVSIGGNNYSNGGGNNTSGTAARGAHAKAEASTGGGAAITGTSGTANANATVQTYVNNGATIITGGGANVVARANNDADVYADGQAAGIVGAGEVLSNATANGITSAFLGGVSNAALGISNLTTGGALQIVARGTNQSDAAANAAGYGVAGLAGAVAHANAQPTVNAFATIAGTGLANVTGAASISAYAAGNSSSNAAGVSGSVVGGGASQASSTWKPTVNAFVGGSSKLHAGGAITVSANDNYDENGSENTGNITTAQANASFGGLGGEADNVAGATVDAHVKATLKSGAEVVAGGNLSLLANARNNAKANTVGSAAGVVGIGSASSSSMVSNEARATTESSVTLQGSNIVIHAVTDNALNSTTSGAGGGLVSTNEADAYAIITVNSTEASIGNFNTVTAGTPGVAGLLDIQAYQTANLYAQSLINASGGVTNNDALARAQILSASTTATIGSNTTVNVNHLNMTANDANVTVNADTNSDSDFSAANFTTADSSVTANLHASVNIGAGTAITAIDAVNLLATASGINTYSTSKSATTGISGSLTSYADNYKTTATDVNTAATSTFITKTFSAVANGDFSGQFVSTPRTDAQTVTEFVQTGLKTVCKVIGEVVCLWGVACSPDEVCDTVIEGFFREIGAGTDAVANRGTPQILNSVNLNSDITITGSADPKIEVDSTGKIITLDGVSATNGINNTPLAVGQTVTSGKIVVNDITNPSSGNIVVQAYQGSTSGHSNILFKGTFGSVQILNAAPIDVFVHNIETFNISSPPSISHIGTMGQSNWTYNLTTNSDSTLVLIQNTNTTHHNITLQGHIINPAGTTQIFNAGGDIFSTSVDSYINTNTVDLKADHGTIGTLAQRIHVLMPVDSGMAASTMDMGADEGGGMIGGPSAVPGHIQEAIGDQGVYLDVTPRTVMGSTTAISISNVMSAHGNADVQINSGVSRQSAAITTITKTDSTVVSGIQLEPAFDPSTAVDNSADTIDFGFAHGLSDGDAVSYQTNGGTAIQGLRNGITYHVRVFDATRVELVSTFNSQTSVNGLTDTIDFGIAHGLQTGDQVIYKSNGGPGLDNLTDGAVYFVRVVNATSIKLGLTLADVTAVGSTFTPSTAVAANAITFAAAQTFVTGQAVTYRSTGVAMSGLVNGRTYYVVALSTTQFELASTMADALAATPVILTLSAAGATGTHSIGTEGIDLAAAATGASEYFRIDIDSAGATGTAQFLDTNSVYVQVNTTTVRVKKTDIALQTYSVATTQVPVTTAVTLGDISAAQGNVVINVGNIDTVQSNITLAGTISAPLGKVTINTIAGSIMGSMMYTVSGHDLSFTAIGGMIGMSGSNITTHLGSGLLDASATNGIYISQVGGPLQIGSVNSSRDEVVLTVADTAAAGSDIALLSASQISAFKGVTLNAGDNIDSAAGAHVTAGTASLILIRGDYGNADVGVGTTMHLLGTFSGGSVEVDGQTDADAISVGITNTGAPLTVNGSDGADILSVVSSNGTVVVQAGNGADTINIGVQGQANAFAGSVTIHGGAGDDLVHVLDTAVILAPSVQVAIFGEQDNNTLQGPDGAATWNITSNNNGKINSGVQFTNMQNLIGGALADLFTFANGQGITGNLDGGPGNDTLDYSAYTTAVTVNLETSKATNIGGTFARLENFTGSPLADTFIGADTANAWAITANNTGTVNSAIRFTSFENLTGGASTDAFAFADGKGVSGNIDGMGGFDTLDWSAYTTPVTANRQTAIATGIGGTFAGIEKMIGGFAVDTLIGRNIDAGWNVTGTDSGNVDNVFFFENFQNLIGGTIIDTFTFYDGQTITGVVTGSPGVDLITFVNFSSEVVFHIQDTNSGYVHTNFGDVVFTSVENLTGGQGNDQFIFADGKNVTGNIDGQGGFDTLDWNAYTTPVTVNRETATATGIGGTYDGIEKVIGGSAFDTLIGKNADAVWTITGDNTGNINDDFYFISFENLTGGSGQDTFRLQDGKTISGKLDGGLGSDTVDYSLWTSGILVNLIAGRASGVFGGSNGGLVNVENITGGAGNDTMIGDDGDNILRGGLGNDTLIGNGGNDILDGGPGDDLMDGGLGNDTYIEVPGSNDVMKDAGGIDTIDFSGAHLGITIDLHYGNGQVQVLDSAKNTLALFGTFENVTGSAFDDRITGNDSANVLIGNAGSDVILGFGGDDIIDGGMGNDVLTGDLGNDILTGGDGNDTITGGLGDDNISGGKGDDSISGDDGNDTIAGDEGNDFIHGGTGNDTITGGADNDTIYGDAGDDNIAGNDGNDYVEGGAGNDVIAGGMDDDTLSGGQGDDVITGDGGNDTIAGDSGNDTIFGNAGNDTIDGGSGNDLIDGGTGADKIDGGDGSDTLQFLSATFGVTVDLAAGTAVDGTGSTDSIKNIENVYGTAYSDVLLGNENANALYGFGGVDQLDGRNGDDFLAGGDGADTLIGGFGNDTLVGGADADNMSGGDGDDQFIWSVGDGMDTLSGGNGFNTLFINGSANNDSIAAATNGLNMGSFSAMPRTNIPAIMVSPGSAGAKLNGPVMISAPAVGAGPVLDGGTFTGIQVLNVSMGMGDDELVVTGLKAGQLTKFIADLGGGNDTLVAATNGAAAYATMPLQVSGGTGDDLFYGGAGNDVFDGGLGQDTIDYSRVKTGVNATLAGWGNNDGLGGVDNLQGFEVLAGSDFADVLNGSNNADIIYGRGGNDIIAAGSGNDYVDGGADNDIIDGQGGNDELHGGTGNDAITGGAGDDILEGGIGNDKLTGGSGVDRYLAEPGNDTIIGGNDGDILDYSASNGPVNVDLGAGVATDGMGGVDAVSGITEIIGTRFSDVLKGDGADNIFMGLAGNDTIIGGGGNDTFTGGLGDDTISNNSGKNTVLYFAGDGSDSVTAPGTLKVWTTDGADVLSLTSNSLQISTPGMLPQTLSLSGLNATELYTLGGADVVNVTPGTTGFTLKVDLGDDADTLQAAGSQVALTVLGGAGDDTVEPGLGSFNFDGGTGFNTLDFRLHPVSIKADLGLQNVHDAAGRDYFFAHVSGLIGSAFGDKITVAGNSLVDGFGGNDEIHMYGDGNTIHGGDGNDTIYGGDGNDQLFGDADNDTIYGGKGDDLIDGGTGDDFLYGEAGNDTLIGGAGNDLLDGGTHNTGGFDVADYSASPSGVSANLGTHTAADGLGTTDTLNNINGLSGSAFADTLMGDDNANQLQGNGGPDSLMGKGGDDFLYGGAGADNLDGGEGNDTLAGGLDDDTVAGGLGADTILYQLGDGNDTVSGQGDTDTLMVTATGGDDVVNVTATGGLLKVAIGGSVITADTTEILSLDMGAGNDTVFVGLLTGAGVQKIVATLGAGNDLLDASASSTNIVATGDAGNDTLIGGSGDDQLSGNADDDTLIGNGGNDTLLGGDGNDTLNGGPGNDLSDGGANNDTYIMGTGNDTVTDASGVDLLDFSGMTHGVTVDLSHASGDLQNITIAGDTLRINGTLENVTGSGFDDTITGNNADNILDGGTGNDVLTGGNGNDTLIGGTGNDTLDGGAGNDTLLGGDDNDTLLGGQDNDLLDGGNGNDSLDGGAGNDMLSGGDGNDSLNGGLGADTLDGGIGNDTLLGGTVNDGNDILIGWTGSDTLIGAGPNTQFFGGEGNDAIIVSTGENVVDTGPGNDSVTLNTGHTTVTRGPGAKMFFTLQGFPITVVGSDPLQFVNGIQI